jgi:uncharacterized membrane protein YccC
LQARLAARDPGWRRARRALAATAGAAISLAINSAVASAAGQATGVALLGTVVAMVSGLSVTEDDRREAALTFLLLPFLGAASVALGASLSTHRFVADAVFVVIVFAATGLRRRGPRWSAGGFLAFMTYFFSQFLHALPAQVPWLALSATIGVAVAAVLRLVVLPERPQSTLRHLLQALNGQTAALLDAAVAVLEAPDLPNRLRRRVVAASGDLNRVALLVEQQLGVAPESAPADRADGQPSGEPLRDGVFMVEVAAAHTVSAVRAAVREGLSTSDRAALASEITAVSRAIRSGRAPRTLSRWAETTRAAVEAGARSGSSSGADSRYRGAPHVRRALAELADAAAALQRGDRDVPSLDMWHEREGVGSESGHQTRKPDPYLGLKQGLQATVAVALAIGAGELLSPTRWYWAAIAAYIVFVGADTREATVRRAVARTVGTLGGLIGGLLVAALVSGSKPAAIVLIFVLLFAAWWLQPVSFFAGSICVTVVLALLYVLLGTYSGHILLLRVEETAIGAVLGGIAALVLVPTRSSPVVREAEADVLDRVADLVLAIRDRSGSGSALREVDSTFQDLRDVARPVSQGVPGTAARRVEQRVFALAAATYSARMLVTALLHSPQIDEETGQRMDQLGARARGLARAARNGTSTDEAPPSQPPDHRHGDDSPQSGVAAAGDGLDSDTAARALDRTHARVALERLDLALTRWSDPFRSPLPPGTPAVVPDGSTEGRPRSEVRSGS